MLGMRAVQLSRSWRCSTCPGTLLGVPVLYAYIFVAWAALIALMALVAESGD